MKKILPLILLVFAFGCKKKSPEAQIKSSWAYEYQAVGLLGDTLRAPAPAKELIEKYEAKKEAFEENPKDLDNLIWYGRFTAYLGNYREAIDIYTKGLEMFPNESRLLRHRGHRYITVREFDKAIADLSKAAELIQGTVDTIEEDGMPNAHNIPVSTQHGNIYYHLGLAYYLDRQMLKSLDAFKKCLSLSNSPDNVVSCTHWIYMIHNRMGRKAAGDNYLRNITKDMNVLENTSYYQACLFYKGALPMEDVYDPNAPATAPNTALKYAIGNWIWYSGNPQKGQEIFRELLKGGDWASFGYIAAEVDLAKPYVAR